MTADRRRKRLLRALLHARKATRPGHIERTIPAFAEGPKWVRDEAQPVTDSERDYFTPLVDKAGRLRVWVRLLESLGNGEPLNDDEKVLSRFLLEILAHDPRLLAPMRPEKLAAARGKGILAHLRDLDLALANREGPPEPGSRDAKKRRAAEKSLGMPPARKPGRPPKPPKK